MRLARNGRPFFITFSDRLNFTPCFGIPLDGMKPKSGGHSKKKNKIE